MTDTAELRSICTAADIAPAEGTGAPDWVELLPTGRIKGRDGRLFVLDNPQGVVDASLTPGAELPIDYEHQADDPARRANGPVPAAGWITELALRDGAIWGRVSWTVKASNMIAAREYRYLSPVLLHRRDGQVTRLLGAGLVHRPNLDLKALASEELPARDGGRTDALAPIAEALGLNAATATAGEIVAAIAEASSRPDPAKFMPIEAVQELLRSHHEAKAVLSQDRAEGKVRDAMAAGYLTPAMRDWAVSLCRQDPDSFDAFLSSAAPAYGHLLSRNGQRPGARPGAVPAVHDADALAIARNLGLDPSRLLE
jgi:phage I-like protein